MFVLISGLTSKKRSNQKNKGNLLCRIAPNLYDTMSNPLDSRKTKLLKNKTTEFPINNKQFSPNYFKESQIDNFIPVEKSIKLAKKLI